VGSRIGFWHPSGVRVPKERYPGVSSQTPQPPATFCQPFGLVFGGREMMRPVLKTLSSDSNLKIFALFFVCRARSSNGLRM